MSAPAVAAGAGLSARIAAEHAAVAAELPAEVVSRKRRREALEALLAQGVPASREENWRYAGLRGLEKLSFAPVAPGAPLPHAGALPAPLPGFARLTFVDGVRVPALSSRQEIPGLSPMEPSPPPVERLPRRSAMHATTPDGRFALLNEAFARDAATLRIGATGERVQLELLFVSSAAGAAGASYPRVEIELEPGAQVVLAERHVSAGGEAGFINAAVALDLGRGAALHHYRMQHAGPQAVWLDTLSAVLAQEAVYRMHAVMVGGLSARSTMYVLLAGERADVSLSMASLAERTQVQDAYALIEHAVPACRTEQTFRGIAGGRSRVGFNGKVVVQAGAAGTDSRQSLKGLLAGPAAEIDVRPQLEIYTDDVKASHGATAGKLDEGMLFYLLSRGLSPEVAQQLLKWAFLEDVVSRIEVPELRRQIEQSLAGQMTGAAALQGAV